MKNTPNASELAVKHLIISAKHSTNKPIIMRDAPDSNNPTFCEKCGAGGLGGQGLSGPIVPYVCYQSGEL